MKLGFAAGSITIRIHPDELAKLAVGGSIGLHVALPRGHEFRVKLNQTQTEQWHFDSDPTGLWLTVPRAQLDILGRGQSDMHCIQQTFMTHQDEVVIRLELDV